MSTKPVLLINGNPVGQVGEEGGSGGHTIIDSSGSSLAQESGLQFADSFVSDDDVNGRTVVENVKELTLAELSQATERGMYLATDEESVPIGEIEEDVVEVEADGVKNYTQLLDELYLKIDPLKLSLDSYIELPYAKFRYQRTISYSNQYVFALKYGSTVTTTILTVNLNNSSSFTTETQIRQNGNTINNTSSDVPTEGAKITLHYGTSSGIVELNTDARHCMMSDGVTSVESALTNKCKILNGTVTNDFSGGIITKINFPTSFTKDNSVVISSYISADNGVSWYPIRDGSSSSNYVYVESTGIYLYNGDGSWTGRKYRIALSQF